MGQAEQSIPHLSGLTELNLVGGFEKGPVEFKAFCKTLLPQSVFMHCREWPAGKTNVKIKCSSQQATCYRDLHGRMSHKCLVWLGFHDQAGYTKYTKTVHEDSGVHEVTTSSQTMEVEAATHSIHQRDAQITHAIILTDSMNLLQKVESGMGCPDWNTAMHSPPQQIIVWVYCPGHAGVRGKELK